MRAYNTNLGLLLPGVRVDWIGLNLEDFMRRVLLAVKSARKDNLSYPPYPIARHSDNPDMATSHAEEVIRLAENQLSRYVVLPQETAMIAAYRKLMKDVGQESYPRRMEQLDFYSYYLAQLAFPALELAFDALFWYLTGRTSRILTAKEGVELIYAFFQDPETQLAPDRAVIVRERYAKLVPPEMQVIEMVRELAESPFASAKYIIVGREDAPLEGANTVFVEFMEGPARAKLSCRIPAHALEPLGSLSNMQAQVETVMMKLAEERLGPVFAKPAGKSEVDAA